MNRKTKKTTTTEQKSVAKVWTVSKLVFQEKRSCALLFVSLAFSSPLPPTFHTLVSQ